MVESRTSKVLKNSIITTLCQFAYLIASFVGRTALTKVLGAEYLGINGLFTNVLTILSFAELGIGSTLVYRMYKPLAGGDKQKLAAYTQLYKKIYTAIIVIVSTCGIAIIPFLKHIVKAPNVKENLILLYALYLFDTIFTYAYVYKKSILIADQKSYIVSIFTQVFNIIMNIVQCIILIITHSFIWYFAVRLICNLLNNISCSYYAQKQYPFIAQKETIPVEKEEIEGLKKDVKGLMLTKVASTAFSGTDNIFISAFIGIESVGILSNYTTAVFHAHEWIHPDKAKAYDKLVNLCENYCSDIVAFREFSTLPLGNCKLQRINEKICLFYQRVIFPYLVIIKKRIIR